jgi:hypothetical protein
MEARAAIAKAAVMALFGAFVLAQLVYKLVYLLKYRRSKQWAW